MQKEACGCAEHARDGGVIPVTGFPWVGGMANEEERAKTNGHGANTSILYNTHSFGPRLIVSGLIPSKRAFSERFESSREVVVHGP